MARVVLNFCGVKSKGGITVLNNFLENNSNLDLFIIYDNPVLHDLVAKYRNELIQVPRYLHPFLNFFMNKSTKEKINNYENIIHFGNLAFKTKIKTFTFIQNILPLVAPTNSFRNLFLRIFYNYSFKISDEIIVQQAHVAKLIPNSSKVNIIGKINYSEITQSNKTDFIVIFENIKNKNPKFTLDLIIELSKLDYKINVIDSDNYLQKQKNIKFTSENITLFKDIDYSQLQNLFKQNQTYIHSSEYETVGLPIYEALNNGLNVVMPDREYFQLDVHNVFKYKSNNLASAVTACKISATKPHSKSVNVPIYYEDWNLNFQ